MWSTRAVIRSSWLVATGAALAVAVAIGMAAFHAPPEDPRTDLYATYQLGRIDLDFGRIHDAADKFTEVARGTSDDGSLHHAALQDLVRAVAEIGDVDTAYSAFRRVDPAYALDMLESLGDLHVSLGNYGKAIHVFRELVAAAPHNGHACMWQYNIAHAQLLMTGTADETVTQIEKLVRSSTTSTTECRDNAAAMAGELARAYHAEAAKTENAETLAYAERLYNAYLGAFPDAADFAETQYFHAELLWSRAELEPRPELKRERWATAAAAFSEVVKTGKAEAKLLRESQYAAVLARNNSRAR